MEEGRQACSDRLLAVAISDFRRRKQAHRLCGKVPCPAFAEDRHKVSPSHPDSDSDGRGEVHARRQLPMGSVPRRKRIWSIRCGVRLLASRAAVHSTRARHGRHQPGVRAFCAYRRSAGACFDNRQGRIRHRLDPTAGDVHEVNGGAKRSAPHIRAH